MCYKRLIVFGSVVDDFVEGLKKQSFLCNIRCQQVEVILRLGA